MRIVLFSATYRIAQNAREGRFFVLEFILAFTYQQLGMIL
jgi:hypothetical protein